jgi:hypothetical protein
MTGDDERFSLTFEMESILIELESVSHSRRSDIETTETSLGNDPSWSLESRRSPSGSADDDGG